MNTLPRLIRPLSLAVCFFAMLLLLFIGVTVPHSQAAEYAGTITGRITAEDSGSPVSGVSVQLLQEIGTSSNLVVSTTTHSDGAYQLNFSWDPNGFYTLCFETGAGTGTQTAVAHYLAECYNNRYGIADLLTFTADGQLVADAQLTRGGMIQGQVRSQANQQALPGVQVSADDSGTGRRGIALTDQQGVYTITGLFTGSYSVQFDTAFYTSARYRNKTTADSGDLVTVDPGQIRPDIDATLTPVGKLQVQVTDAATGASVVNLAHFYFYDPTGQQVPVIREFEQSGIYTFSLPLAGQYRLLIYPAEADGYFPEYYNDQTTLTAATPITIALGQLTVVQVALTRKLAVADLATLPTLPGVLWVSYRDWPTPTFTLDGGVQWQTFFTMPWNSNIGLQGALARRAESGQTTRFIVSAGTEFYRSGDLGATWFTEALARPEGCESASYIDEITLAPTTPQVLYALTHCLYGGLFGSDSIQTIFASQDAGVTWQRWRDGQAVVPSPMLAGRLYVRAGAQWQQTEDQGVTWTDKNFPIDLQQLTLDGKSPQHLYGLKPVLGAGGKVEYSGYRSEDGGAHWSVWALSCQSDYPPTLLAHPTTTQVLFLNCGNQGLYRSRDGGVNWTLLPSAPVSYLAVDYGHPGQILRADTAGLWASSDQGDHWHQLRAFEQRTYQLPNAVYLPVMVR